MWFVVLFVHLSYSFLVYFTYWLTLLHRLYSKQTADANALALVTSRQGRIMLQIGALHEAATLFEESKSRWNTISNNSSSSSHWIFQYIPIQIRIQDGLLAFAHSQYDQSITYFCMSSEYKKEDWAGPTVQRVEAYRMAVSNCWNNLVLCVLYTCRMQDVVCMMESLVRQDPSYYLT